MKGIIGVVCGELTRYPNFWGSLSMLEVPDGVQTEIEYGGTLGLARTALVAKFLQTDAQWLCMIDDDHTFNPQFLRRWLYAHEMKLNQPIRHPIVASLYLMKSAPFTPTLYGEPERVPLLGAKPHSLVLPHFGLKDFPTHGIVDRTLDGRTVYAAGASGLFVRRDVYEAMSPPWYELGQSDNVGEDYWFCVKAQLLGFPVRVDLDSRLGHMTPMEVWPDVDANGWFTSIRRDKFACAIDAGEPSLERVASEVLS